LKLSAVKLRRIALAQQGLLNKAAFGKGKTAVADAVAHLGYVQIDTISVVERAHHHVLKTRVRDYKPDTLKSLVEEKQLFEYWFHAAAYLPMSDYRFALPRMQSIKSGEKHWFANLDQKLLKSVYRRIENEGPLRARDFVDKKQTHTGWWDWKPAKQAIEQLFMQGDLMVVAREGFQKRYDLTERVLPAGIDTRKPGFDEQAEYLINTTLRAHGFASLKSFTYLRKGKMLRAAVKKCLAEYIDEGSVVLIQAPTGERYYCDANRLESNRRPANRVQLLSPFDNLVIQRARCREIFNFDYQIECYVPATKRQYGYFCLPILYRDRLVGRADCKADRKKRELRVIMLQHEVLDGDFIEGLASALNEFRRFNCCDVVIVENVQPAATKKRLITHLKS